MGKKTDNSNLPAKLELRRYFLTKYHGDDPAHVLDCCQGEGVIWGHLRREFPVASYWALDIKPKKGRLKLDSVRVLQQPGWPQNVVDVDTYGSPWKHWAAILENLSRPTTVFLTVGLIGVGGWQSLSEQEMEHLGLTALRRRIPPAIQKALVPISNRYSLGLASAHDVNLVEAIEAVSPGHFRARYLGARLEPKG